MVKKVQFDPGAVLDRVISSAQPEDECYLYKLADFKKSGQLVDAFNTTGSKVRSHNSFSISFYHFILKKPDFYHFILKKQH